MLYWKRFGQVFVVSSFILTSACGGSGGGASTEKGTTVVPQTSNTTGTQNAPQTVTSASSTSSVAPIAAEDQVSVSGKVTYDRIPFEGRSYRGLDYAQTVILPARGVTVQALNSKNGIVAQTQTDSQGAYQFTLTKNQSIRVRVLAELALQENSSGLVQVKDNTNGDAQFVLDGSLASTGAGSTQERDLHAASGWSGTAYQGERTAAPFAILDSVFDAVNMVVQAKPGVVLPPLSVFWSPKNIAISGNARDGNIGTSYYTSSGPSIYLLGAADNDSDEYDRGVIQHEFGHYIEHQLARTESLGGSHNQGSRLDLRVAFGEAWGNAFAGMASGDPIYRDSFGSSQSLAFAIDVESKGFGGQGWFSEASIQAILYDLFDSKNDAADDISLGFAPILDVITSDEYLSFDGFASIYPFIEALKNQKPEFDQNIYELVNSFNITGTGWYGDGETNNGGSAVVLPLYQELQLSQTIKLCSDSDFQDYNGMDVRRFVRISLPTTRSYQFAAVKTAGGLAKGNPQIRIFKQGNEVASLLSNTVNSEKGNRTLSAGTYIVELYEEANVDNNADNSGLACFNLTVN